MDKALPSEIRKTFTSLTSKRWVLVLLILFPAMLEAIYIKMFGVNVVFWDQWIFVSYIEKLYAGNISFNDLFQQYVEHRIFFPKLIIFFLIYVSNFNNIYEMYFSWFLALLILLLVFLIYKESFGISSKMLIYFIPISFLIFSLRQFGNILWGLQIQIYAFILGFLLALYMLEISDKFDFKFLIAAFGGIFASYSFANGLAVWPVGLFFILLSNKRKGLAVIWSLIGLLAMGIYFYAWEWPQRSHPSTLSIIEQPVEGLFYFLANIGSPLAFKAPLVIVLGITLLVLFSAEIFTLIRYRALKENAQWFSLILFSLISSFGITIFRGGYGVEQAFDTRYVTITHFAIIGIYCLALNIYNKDRENKMHLLLLRAILLMLIAGLIVGNTYGLLAGPSNYVYRTDCAYYLETYEHQTDDNLRSLFPDPAAVRNLAPILEKYELNVFSNGHIDINERSGSSYEYNMRMLNTIIQKYFGGYK